MSKKKTQQVFPTDLLIRWQKSYGRNDLPWQSSHDPYKRWLAEIMLQQTQVKTVIPYYTKFLELFPTVEILAGAAEDEVMAAWSGLGYYSRARNLHACAKEIVSRYNGQFPMELESLLELPGIGKSTAGAIISAVTDKPAPMLDANVKKVFARFFMVEEPMGSSAFEKKLWKLAENNLPNAEGRAFSQGLMDLGSLVCLKILPECNLCPVSEGCLAHRRNWERFYPVKTQKKQKPTRVVYWKVYASGNRVFLEKRLGDGVWKSLWCLPESVYPPIDACYLTTVRHVFTHYKLIAHVMVMPHVPNLIESESSGWFTSSDLKGVGIPTPVKKFLEAYFSAPPPLLPERI